MEIKDSAKRFFASAECVALNRKRRTKRIRHQLLKAAFLWALAVILSLAARFTLFGWLITCASAVLLSVTAFRLYALFSGGELLVGRVVAVRHDYRIAHERGTGGWGTWYTTMREKHTVIVSVQVLDTEEKYRDIVCAPRYERVYAVGNILLFHPDFGYPAVLAQDDRCVCFHCGAICSADASVCDCCGAPLCNRHTLD